MKRLTDYIVEAVEEMIASNKVRENATDLFISCSEKIGFGKLMSIIADNMSDKMFDVRHNAITGEEYTLKEKLVDYCKRLKMNTNIKCSNKEDLCDLFNKMELAIKDTDWKQYFNGNKDELTEEEAYKDAVKKWLKGKRKKELPTEGTKNREIADKEIEDKKKNYLEQEKTRLAAYTYKKWVYGFLGEIVAGTMMHNYEDWSIASSSDAEQIIKIIKKELN